MPFLNCISIALAFFPSSRITSGVWHEMFTIQIVNSDKINKGDFVVCLFLSNRKFICIQEMFTCSIQKSERLFKCSELIITMFIHFLFFSFLFQKQDKRDEKKDFVITRKLWFCIIYVKGNIYCTIVLL